MTKERVRKAAAITAVVIGFAVLITIANFVAGAILFASYRENPAKASFWTIERAWMDARDDRARLKVQGSAIGAALLILGVPFALLMAYRRRPGKIHGAARFASTQDLEKEKLLASKGIILGMHQGKLIRFAGYEFAMVAAPTRSGKGVSFVVPNLLTFPDSMVVLDIKGENYDLTSMFRRQHMENEVYVLNPFSANSHRWNPLSYVSSDLNFRVNDVLAQANILYPDDPKDRFWIPSARDLFTGLALLVLESPELPKTYGEILRQASGKGQPVTDYLRSVMDYHRQIGQLLSRECTDALNRFLGNSADTLKGIVSTLTAPLSPWSNPLVDKATSADDFDLRDLRKKKMTVYLHIPAAEILQASFIVNLFFSQLINENVKELPEQNPALKYQCLLMLDEFTAMGKVQIIAKGAGYIAGYNLRLALIIQDGSQLVSAYGKEDADNITKNMGVRVFFTPSTVEESELYSKMIGDDTIQTTSEQRSNIGALNVGRYGLSETVNQTKRALMLPQELREMSRDKSLVVRSGIPVVHADKIRYYEEDFFAQRFKAVPMHQVTIQGEARMVPVPLRRPPENWTAYRSQVARSDFYVSPPAMPELEMATDLLLVGINNPNTDQPAKDRAIAELARRKFEEFNAMFDAMPALSDDQAAVFERG